MKTLWISSFVFVMGIVRPRRIRVKLLDAWTVANIVLEIAAMLGFIALFGMTPFWYLLASSVFAIGLHPLGARWVQEHFALRDDQETYSYYGPLNKVSFNVGYHNEHHDLVTVPWSRLPHIRRGAPEFYENLASYSSWTGLLVRFLADRSITLFRYVVRPAPGESTTSPAPRS
jgi:sphingolipid delta-4 desaturase